MVCLKAVTVTRELNILCLPRVWVGGCAVFQDRCTHLTYLHDFLLPVTLCLWSYFACCPLLVFHGYL